MTSDLAESRVNDVEAEILGHLGQRFWVTGM